MIQVLFSFLVAAVQLNVGEGWKSGLHAWTQPVDLPVTRLYQCTLSRSLGPYATCGKRELRIAPSSRGAVG